MSDLDAVRRRYAEEIRDVLKARFGIALSKPLVDAFGKVSREHFLGTGTMGGERNQEEYPSEVFVLVA
jgi:hypothetical protein